MNVLCLAVYYSDTCEEACRGGEVSSHILTCIVFQTLISMYLLGTYCNVNIEYGMESILFDERMRRGGAMNMNTANLHPISKSILVCVYV